MKALVIAFLLTVCAVQPVAGLLSPLSQELVELKTLLQDPALEQLVGSGEIIQEIKKTENGYVLTTSKQKVFVNVNYTPINRPGPAQFKLSFSKE